ncbi:hypothetical protein [Streptomyces sp. NBC_01264]|uniref:hypothetical protein n=1 Tax=Streptomyces sp. NBC_01264 TaxID=2903804 RepID=UPI002257EA12|nr:hypothetical protein [Streptomyces sp. NBC_01264]MCX4783326.1 hypothetical protein [Streptomyces sp. NBC_01264]
MEHLRDAAESIRKFNLATLRTTALAGPPDVSDVVQSLITIVHRIPQALEQTSGALQRHHREGSIRMDDGSDPRPAVLTAEENLTAAEVDLTDDILPLLKKAGAATARMGTTRV